MKRVVERFLLAKKKDGVWVRMWGGRGGPISDTLLVLKQYKLKFLDYSNVKSRLE